MSFFCYEDHDHAKFKCIPPVPLNFCRRHASSLPCGHCAEDAKILEETIDRVAVAVGDMCFAVRESDMDAQAEAQASIRDTLRDLVREVRR